MFQVRDVSTKSIKYAGRSTAVVIDNADPYARGYIRINHPIFNETGWIEYLRAPTSYDVPSIGDVVYVESDAGYASHMVAWGNVTLTDAETDTLELPTAFQRVYPTNRGFFTPGGHLVEFDDGLNPKEPSATGAQGIRITTSGGNFININDEFSTITIQDFAGNQIKTEYGEGGFIGIQINSQADVQVNAPGKITLTSTGKTIVNATGEIDVMSAAAINITASAKLVQEGSEIDLNGSTGMVLTNVTDPVVDSIFGAPTVGVPTVKAG